MVTETQSLTKSTEKVKNIKKVDRLDLRNLFGFVEAFLAEICDGGIPNPLTSHIDD